MTKWGERPSPTDASQYRSTASLAEFELLRFLVENKNRALRPAQPGTGLGLRRFIETRSVNDVGRAAGLSAQIQPVVGLGYRFVD